MLNPRQRLRPRLPLLGDAPAFRQDLLATLARGRFEQGDVARYRLGPVTVYGVSSPEDAERVLTDSDTFGKLGPDNPLRLALGDGLLTRSDHDSWLRNRRMVAPIYHRRRVETMYTTMQDCVQEMLVRWQDELAPGAVIDLHTQLMHVTLDIVSRCMFSMPMISADSALRPESVEYAVTYTFLRLQNPVAPPTWVPTPANRRFAAIIGGLDELMASMITQRRRTLAAGEPGKEDLLDMLMRATDADTGAQMNDTELRDEIITTLAAGHETTAITLTWAFYLLSTHPVWRRRVIEEIDAVLAGRAPTVADLPKLPLVAQVFDEALRMFPSSPTVPRQSRRPVRLGPYDVEVGSRVLIDVHGLHRNRRHWPDPEVFDPTRFGPEGRSGRSRWAHLPFGGGPHLCVGKQFALQEAQLLLASIFSRYDVRHHPGYPVDDRATITLRPRHGLRVVLHPRLTARLVPARKVA
ncbi:MAG: cytochrome P450 [Microlunatus sp.]|nr:cytochrome P450 [Microlunatus sp.]